MPTRNHLITNLTLLADIFESTTLYCDMNWKTMNTMEVLAGCYDASTCGISENEPTTDVSD